MKVLSRSWLTGIPLLVSYFGNMRKDEHIVIIGAGVFGLSTALQLAQEGYSSVTVIDRTLPPVPDGSSVDISRIIRFDYTDEVYVRMAKEAYDQWVSSDTYKESFNPCPFVIVAQSTVGPFGRSDYSVKTTQVLDKLGLEWHPLSDASVAKRRFPELSGPLAAPGFQGYYNEAAGWADAQKAIRRLRDDCAAAGVSFITGPRGTATKLLTAPDGKITGVQTLAGDTLHADTFILSAGAWSASLVPMDNSVISTAQIIGFIKLPQTEVDRLADLPIYINQSTGWFCFPPHKDTGYLKIAVHGFGYTNSITPTFSSNGELVSSPLHERKAMRSNFGPEEGKERLFAGLKEALPEFCGYQLDKTCLCWYTDTPTGDFIMDYHPRHSNLFVATGGSGHGFKFLPILGKYVSGSMHRTLPEELLEKWKFRTEYRDRSDVFKGDGSRGGPERREFTGNEKAKL